MSLFKAVNNYAKVQIENEVESVRKGVLIVDDSMFSRNILKDMLKAEGYLIVGEAGDGLQAIEMAREKKPEYIFMDVEMPKLDGIGAIPKVLEVDPEIKIIMCTALGQKNIILEAAKAGAKDYVLKPYLKENITGVLKLISEKKQKEQKDRQVIPFKLGKKNQDDINNMILDEKRIEPLGEVEKNSEENYKVEDFKVEDDFVIEKYPEANIDLEALLEPLDYEEENVLEEGLDSLLDGESLQDNIGEEVLESFVNEETLEKADTDDHAEPEDALTNEETSVEVSEEIADFMEVILDDETSDEETKERAEFVKAVLSEETATNMAESEAEHGKAIVNEETSEVKTDEVDPEEAIVNVEVPTDKTEDEVNSEEAKVNEDKPENKTEGEADPEKSIVNDETSNEKAEDDVNPENAIVNEETSREKAEDEANPEEAIVNEETLKEKTESEANSEEIIVNEETSMEKAEDQVNSENTIVNKETSEEKTEDEVNAENAIVNEETSKEKIEDEANPEEAIVSEKASDTEIEGRVESQEAIVNEDISEDKTIDEVKSEVLIVSHETSKDTIELVAKYGEAIGNQGAPANFNILEDFEPDLTSDSSSYTYLWNNRFELLQKEINVQKTVSQRVSFYEYAYLETDRDNIFGNYYSNREMLLGMMNAYMSLENRLLQTDSAAIDLRTLTYPKEIRLFTSNILEECNDEFNEVTIVNTIKYNSLKPKRNSQQIMNKTGFYQVMYDFVNGKSGRVLR